jgi:hypothetical protein
VAYPGHEQGGEHDNAARGLAAHPVIHPQPVVAPEAADRPLRLPAPLLEPEAPADPRPSMPSASTPLGLTDGSVRVVAAPIGKASGSAR